MKIERTGDSLSVSCPAKVNLFLEIHGRRPDGYHEIETVMQAVTVYDTIALQPRADGAIVLRCSDPTVPAGPDNLAHRAADLLRREVGLPAGVSIALDKQIPSGAGLGGGSSDAAGVLAGLNELFELGLDKPRLGGLAARLGSDVAFFGYGGTALCTGRGERVTPIPADLEAHYVICCPPRPLSTAQVYENLSRLGLTSAERSASVIMDFLARGDFGSACQSLFNRLDEVAVSLSPEVREVKELLTRRASTAALVSGSGSAVYVLLDSGARAAEVAGCMSRVGVGRVFVARPEPISNGA